MNESLDFAVFLVVAEQKQRAVEGCISTFRRCNRSNALVVTVEGVGDHTGGGRRQDSFRGRRKFETYGPQMPSASISTLVSAMSCGRFDIGTQTSVTKHLEPGM